MLAQQDSDTQMLEQIRKINDRLYSLERKMDLLADLLKNKTPEHRAPANPSLPKVSKPLSPIDFYDDESNQYQHDHEQPSHQPNKQQHHQRNNQPAAQPNAQQNNRPQKERKMYSAVCADCQKDCSLPFQPRADRPVYCKECFARRKNPKAFKPQEEQQPQAASEVQPAVVEVHSEVKAGKAKKTKAAAKPKKKTVTAKKAAPKKAPAKKAKRK